MEEFQALLDAAVDGVILLDHQGCVQVFNRAAERLFGYPASEVIGANIDILMAEPDRSGAPAPASPTPATSAPVVPAGPGGGAQGPAGAPESTAAGGAVAE